MCWMEILLVSSMFTIFDSKCIIPLQLSYFSLFFYCRGNTADFNQFLASHCDLQHVSSSVATSHVGSV